jgi:hypothetical protein
MRWQVQKADAPELTDEIEQAVVAARKADEAVRRHARARSIPRQPSLILLA